MGSYVLRGITTALLVTVLTLFAGIVWSSMGLGGLSISKLLDIGLLASCLVGGYRTAKESKLWFMGGVAGAGYVTVGTLLLALFLPIRGLGFIQILAEGALIGLVAGAFGAGKKATVSTHFTPSYAGFGREDRGSNNFEWDTEEDITPRANPSKLKWIDSYEEEFAEISETRCEPVVEWPWDREPETKNETENVTKNEIATRGSNQVRNDLAVWDRVGEKAKPWWEQ
ncbi:hypothetical protein [Desulfosporosinus nitroreducens]|uniref:hypothetical protein n=1 Tax=Desulfosporosinus nitroreducens TaxID=2018668 RepID=UPI00207D1770|nr:hypothetical protein [Desulfosporosinus nitroreducens]MCO1601030.1 hypothetical protein [Desulfosporosinus nitroreducens]